MRTFLRLSAFAVVLVAASSGIAYAQVAPSESVDISRTEVAPDASSEVVVPSESSTATVADATPAAVESNTRDNTPVVTTTAVAATGVDAYLIAIAAVLLMLAGLGLLSIRWGLRQVRQ